MNPKAQADIISELKQVIDGIKAGEVSTVVVGYSDDQTGGGLIKFGDPYLANTLTDLLKQSVLKSIGDVNG